jgi:hypothetical protein
MHLKVPDVFQNAIDSFNDQNGITNSGKNQSQRRASLFANQSRDSFFNEK